MQKEHHQKEGTLQDKNYTEFKKAEAWVEEVLKQIEEVHVMVPDKKQAEKIIVVRFAHKMSRALQDAQQTFENWIDGLKKDDRG